VTMPDSTRAAPAAVARVALSMTAQATTTVPKTTWMTLVAAAQATTVVPETMRATPVAAVKTPGGSATRYISSRQGCRF
jgi:hypothetical protein